MGISRTARTLTVPVCAKKKPVGKKMWPRGGAKGVRKKACACQITCGGTGPRGSAWTHLFIWAPFGLVWDPFGSHLGPSLIRAIPVCAKKKPVGKKMWPRGGAKGVRKKSLSMSDQCGGTGLSPVPGPGWACPLPRCHFWKYTNIKAPPTPGGSGPKT